MTAGVPRTRSDDAARIRGWCPSAHRPMLSGDGLVFRVRPFFGELTAHQALGLCDLADTFGNGMLDLTSRANIQIRGVAERDQSLLLERLDRLGLIDSDAEIERRRNILMPHTWAAGDLTHRLAKMLMSALSRLPALPDKMGFAIDTSDTACLSEGSADFRFELDADGHLLLRADGADLGRKITEATAMDALAALIDWFLSSNGAEHRRMGKHVRQTRLPQDWEAVRPRQPSGAAQPGPSALGTILGAPFGKIAARDLRALLEANEKAHMRPMLGRMFLLTGATVSNAAGFVTAPSRLMQVHACPGAPYCPQATVATLDIAETLAPQSEGHLHVSGCAKGCAFPRAATQTLVGRDGRFDLVSNGLPWDEPCQRGLAPEHLTQANGLL